MAEYHRDVLVLGGQFRDHSRRRLARHAGVKNNRHMVAARRVIDGLHKLSLVGIEELDFGMKLDAFEFQSAEAMIKRFGRRLRPEIGIDAAKADDPFRILGHFLGHDLIRFGIIGVRSSQRKCYRAVQAGLVQVAHQIFTEKAGDSMSQRRLAASQMRVRVDGVEFRVVDA